MIFVFCEMMSPWSAPWLALASNPLNHLTGEKERRKKNLSLTSPAGIHNNNHTCLLCLVVTELTLFLLQILVDRKNGVVKPPTRRKFSEISKASLE
jgi:hypothetical protein